jgi:hypothetical protein
MVSAKSTSRMVNIVDEERRMILQMVSDGKITPEEAQRLLQAIDESERPAASHTADTPPDVGESFGRVIRDSFRGFDQAFRGVEHSLDARLKEMDLEPRMAQKLRRAAERAAEHVARAQEKAARMQERVAEAEERAAEAMERAAERAAEAAERAADHADRESSYTFTKRGISIDKHSVTHRGNMVMQAEQGDRLSVDNRVGDIVVEFVDSDTIEVDLTKVVWGEDRADAEARAERTKVSMVRRGKSVEIETDRPSISGFGVMFVKDTQINLAIRLPHGTELTITNKVGDLKVVGGDQISKWDLKTKVGDIELSVGQVGLTYQLATKVGDAEVELGQHKKSGTKLEGTIGDGSGIIVAEVKTGDVRLRH